MLILGQEFSPEWFGQPPGMPLQDSIVWRVWIVTEGKTFKWFYYNVRLGPSRPAPPGYPENISRMWELNNALRADAIGMRGEEIWLFEVKRRLEPGNVGQILAYAEILKKEIFSVSDLHLKLIGESADPGTREQAKQLGIDIFTLEEI